MRSEPPGRAAFPFLEAEQAASGAWLAIKRRGGYVETDCNAFVTALTMIALAPWRRHPAVSRMLHRGGRFLDDCAAVCPTGATMFWPRGHRHQAVPDLEDTAHAICAMRLAGIGPAPDRLALLGLFAPYRVTAGQRLAEGSRWAAEFPGCFGTWMGDTGPAVVDAGVNANVIRALALCSATDVPGFDAAVCLVAASLEGERSPQAVAPYYRTSARLLWLAAEAAWHCGEPLAAAARRAFVSRKGATSATLAQALPHAMAGRLLGLDAEAELQTIRDARRGGAWPTVALCHDYTGQTEWASRAPAAAMALYLDADAQAFLST
jgi:hypothetical protein